MKGDSNQLNHAVNMDSSSFYQGESFLEDEDMDVPEIVEEIIELLLSGLRDTVCLDVEVLLYAK